MDPSSDRFYSLFPKAEPPLPCSRFRFAEFRYLRRGDPLQRETAVIFLPDVWSCMPSLEEWEALCQQKAEKAPLPSPSPEEKAEMVRVGCHKAKSNGSKGLITHSCQDLSVMLLKRMWRYQKQPLTRKWRPMHRK